MRAFAFLSFAAAALAAPAFVAPGVVNVVAPVDAAVNSATYAVTKGNVDAFGAVGNVDAKYNNIGNNVLNNNKVNVASPGATVNKVAVPKPPVHVNPKTPVDDSVKTHYAQPAHPVYPRGAVDVLAVVTAVLKALVELATKLNVDAEAAIANINLNYNNILNNVGNGNNLNILRRAAVDALVQVIASIIAVVQSCLRAGVDANVLIANIQATCNQIANNVGNTNTVNVARGAGGLLTVVAPITAVISALVVAVTHVCAGLTLEILNVALGYNNILNNVLDNNTINILSH